MKTIAVISPQGKDESTIDPILIQGKPIVIAVLDLPIPHFDPHNDTYKDLILIQKKAFSLNFRDIALIIYADDYLKRDPKSKRFFAVGSEFVGIVKEIGANVKDLNVGDRVIGNASYPFNDSLGGSPGLPTNNASKEYEIFHSSKVIKISDSLPDEVAAGFMVGAQTSFSMIRRAELVPGSKCLVTAANSNTSLFLIAALKRMDVKVTAITSSLKNAKRLLNLGVNRLVLIDREQPLKQNEAFQEMINEEGQFNVIFDPYCDLYAGQLIGHLTTFGKYITCGVFNQYSGFIGEKVPYHGESHINLMVKVIVSNISIIGNCLGNTRDLQNALSAYDLGDIQVVIDSVFDTNELTDFFNQTYNNSSRFGKVIMRFNND